MKLGESPRMDSGQQGVGGVIYLILEGGSVTMILALILTLTTLALSATARTALSESDHQPHALLSTPLLT